MKTKWLKRGSSELERLKLQLQTQMITQTTITTPISETEQPKWELKGILHKFDPKGDEMALFLNLFERQIKFLKVPKATWVPYLIGSLPTEVGKLIAREPGKEYQEYQKGKIMLLRRFKLTADKYRQFSLRRKNTENTWRDFYFELTSYFEGWLSELNVNDFHQLKELILANQIKESVPPDIKEHFVDIWPDLNSPMELVEKL